MPLLKIGITHGDINGIGYEMLLKVFQDPEMLEFCTPVVFGSAIVIEETARRLDLPMVPLNIIGNASEAIDGRVNMVPVCGDAEPELQFAEQTEASLQAEAKSLTAALDAFNHHDIAALVTLPGHLDNDETSHALSDFIHRALGIQDESFDWILKGPLRALQLHPLDVSTQLGEGLASEAFQRDLKAISQSLRFDFGLMRPRIAVVSPQQKLHDDLEELHEEGVFAFGPLPAKDFIDGRWFEHYDGSLFLNEDEAFKQIICEDSDDYAIGYVSGLPLVLTYPLVSIGYDIAGQGKADESPLRHTIYAAIDILRNRIRYRHATHHPLEKQWVPRGRDDFKLDLTKEEE